MPGEIAVFPLKGVNFPWVSVTVAAKTGPIRWVVQCTLSRQLVRTNS